jgi:hypothetical protein
MEGGGKMGRSRVVQAKHHNILLQQGRRRLIHGLIFHYENDHGI